MLLYLSQQRPPLYKDHFLLALRVVVTSRGTTLSLLRHTNPHSQTGATTHSWHKYKLVLKLPSRPPTNWWSWWGGGGCMLAVGLFLPLRCHTASSRDWTMHTHTRLNPSKAIRGIEQMSRWAWQMPLEVIICCAQSSLSIPSSKTNERWQVGWG